MKDFRELLEKEGILNKRINIGCFGLSIQASYAHYCQPRINSNDNFLYSNFEVALFENNEWLNPKDDDRFIDMVWLKDVWESGKYAVGGYIPTNKVQELCNRLESLGGQVHV